MSSVKVKAATAETLPATSVCRTSMVLAPWTRLRRDRCASCVQVLPPSSRVLRRSRRSRRCVSVSAALEVIWSLLACPAVAGQRDAGRPPARAVSSVKVNGGRPPRRCPPRRSAAHQRCWRPEPAAQRDRRASVRPAGAAVDRVLRRSRRSRRCVSVSAGLEVIWSLLARPAVARQRNAGSDPGSAVSSVKVKRGRPPRRCRPRRSAAPQWCWRPAPGCAADRGAGRPGGAAIERVLDLRPGLDAAQRQRRIVGDVVAAR